MTLLKAGQAQTDELAVDQQVGHRQIRPTPEVGHAHDRELQPLRRVHAHQAHRVGLDIIDRGIGL